MKKIASIAVVVAGMAFFTLTSCKDKDGTTTTAETLTTQDDAKDQRMENDTAAVKTANDSDVSGTTGGVMEQVP